MSTIVLTKPQGGGSSSGTTLQLYSENPSSPVANVITGANAVAIGSGNVATSSNSLALGLSAKAALFGQIAHASGQFLTIGDAQGSDFIFRGQTTTAIPTEIFLDGVSSRLILSNNSAIVFETLIIARRTDIIQDYAGFRIEGVIKRDGTIGTTAIVGITNKTVISRTNAGLDVNIIADTVNGSLKIIATGIASQSYNWVARIVSIEEIG